MENSEQFAFRGNAGDSAFPPPAPLTLRAAAFLTDAITAFLFAILAVRLLMPLVIADSYSAFVESFEKISEIYGDAAKGGDAAALSARLAEILSRSEIADVQNFVSLVFALTALAWFPAAETLFRGASLGKKIFRLRVISTVTGEAPTKLQCFSRSFWRAFAVAPFGLIVTLFVAVDFTVSFFSKRRHAWHDKLSQTEVIDARR